MREELTLDLAYKWEQELAHQLWMTQPTGGGEVKTFTWAEAMDEARRMAAHLKSLNFPEKSQIALFSKNAAWWIIADLAIWMAGHASVPVFPTLTPDIIDYTLTHSEAKLVFVGKLDGYDEMAPGIPEDLPRIVMPLAPANAEGEGWADILAQTEPLPEPVWRDPDDLATIIYTSGSTGVPKGVMHTFRSIADSVRPLGDIYETGPEERMLSYLPLAHVFERWIVENGSLLAGTQLFFAESIDTFVQDLNRARPTQFVSVPRLWRKFQLGVFQRMSPQRLDFLLRIPILNRIVKRRVLEGLGLDQVKVAGTGSAPIPKELIEWYQKLGLNLMEGWAMTENFAYGTANRPGENKVGTIGRPYPGVDIRISDLGEIQCKSPGMMLGYFKRPDATAETFTEDGWLKTGDRGAIDADGYVKITGRVKEIFKTSKGKYVAPAHIESRLLLHEDVEMACVMGSGFPQPHALLMLSDAARGRMREPSAKAALVDSLQQHMESVNADLPNYERLQFLALTDAEWTIADGLLTPTLKIRRAQMEDRYGPAAQGWYDLGERVVWA